MSLPSQKYPVNVRTSSITPTICKTDDVVLLCDSTTQAIAVTLQEIPDDYWSTQYKLFVIDIASISATNNITINAPSGHTINGASSFVMNSNGSSVAIRIVANKTYICQYSVIGGGGGITQAYQTAQNEGSALTQRSTLNFIGSSVDATDDSGNSRTNVTVQAYNTIQEEGTSLVQRSTLNFIGNGATLSDDLANTKSQVVIPGAETFVCFLAINSTYQPPSGIIPFQVPSSSPANYLGLTDGQIISKYVAVASDNVSVVATAAPLSFVANANLPTSRFGTFDNTTGVFTTSVDGTYLISGSCHFKSNNSTTAFWQTLLTGSIGLGLLGTGNNIYSGNYMNVSQGRESQIDITSTVIAYLPASTSIRMSILNMTDRNYDGTVYTFSDGMRFSITKLT